MHGVIREEGAISDFRGMVGLSCLSQFSAWALFYKTHSYVILLSMLSFWC